MWKNRRKRLTTTPATASVAELDDNVVGNGSLIPPAVVHQQFDSDNCQFDEEDDEFGFGKLRFFNHARKGMSSNNQKFRKWWKILSLPRKSVKSIHFTSFLAKNFDYLFFSFASSLL